MNSLKWKLIVLMFVLFGAAARAADFIPDSPTPTEPATETQPVAQPTESLTSEPAILPEEIQATSPTIPPFEWEESLDMALATAKKESKPVFIEFYVTWQQWCRILDEKTLTDTDVVKLSYKFACVRVDGKESPQLVKKYKVTGYPTIVFLNSRGEQVHRLVGFIPPRPFEREMKDIAEGREPAREFAQLEKSNPKEFRQLVLLAIGYLKRQDWDKAINAYEQALKASPGVNSREAEQVIYSLCQLYDYKGKADKSEKLLLRLLKTEGADKIKVHDMLGHTYLSLKQPEKAIEHFEAERSLVKEDEKQGEFLDRLIEQIRNAPNK